MRPAAKFFQQCQIFIFTQFYLRNFDFSLKITYNIYVKMRKENTQNTHKGENYDKERNVRSHS